MNWPLASFELFPHAEKDANRLFFRPLASRNKAEGGVLEGNNENILYKGKIIEIKIENNSRKT